jgi:hypothetical protein
MSKAELKFGSETWVLKKREEKHLGAAQMQFLIHLLGITKLDKKGMNALGEKTGAQNIVTEIKTIPEKVATTSTEDGHKKNTKTSTAI